MTPHAPRPERRRRGERVERLGEELAFLRALVLRGDWDAAEAFLEPVADHPGVDHRTLRAHIRRQAFLETLAGPDPNLGDPDAAPDPDPDALVAALRELKPLVRDQSQFNDLCFLMTLPSVNDHADYAEWSPARGRLAAWNALAAALEHAYGDTNGRDDSDPNERECAMETAMRRAAAYAATRTSPRYREYDHEEYHHENDDDHDDDGRYEQSRVERERSRVERAPPRAATARLLPTFGVRSSVAASTRPARRVHASSATRASTPAFAAAFKAASIAASKGPSPIATDERRKENRDPSGYAFVRGDDEAELERERGDDDDVDDAFGDDSHSDSDSSAVGLFGEYAAIDPTRGVGVPPFARRADVIVADAGVRHLSFAPLSVRLPCDDDDENDDEFHSRDDGIDGLFGFGALVAATSSRSIHVAYGVGGGAGGRVGRVSAVGAHPPPCSVYASAWSRFGSDPTRSIVATGANDGGVGFSLLRLVEDRGNGEEAREEEARERGARERGARRFRFSLAFAGPTRVTAAHAGAVRSLAFADDAGASLVTGGAGDFAPMVWTLSEDTLDRPAARRLAPHESKIVGVVGDWGGSDARVSRGARGFAATASADGEVRVWDVRDAAAADRRANLVLRVSPGTSGGAGSSAGTRADSAALTSVSLRGDLVAAGFDDGVVAVHDARYPAAGALWRERAHDGECRSVDLCPAARSILSAGLDGTCRVASAQEGSGGGGGGFGGGFGGVRVVTHGGKVACARWAPPRRAGGGMGFASCGTDKTVKVWTPE